MGAYRSFTRWIGAKPWVPSILAPALQRVDTALLHHGRHITPFPTLLLTTTGRHSGAEHESPLWFLRDGADYAVIATNFGRREPDWSLNLRADASCRVRDGNDEFAALAVQAGDDDWAGLFDRFVGFYPVYREYGERAGRSIPIWRLRSVAPT